MSTVTRQPTQRRRPLSLPLSPENEELKAILRARPKRTVAERIEALNSIEISYADLEWMAKNRKGLVGAWAKAELAKLEDID